MKTLIALCLCSAGTCAAQSMDDLNLQVHGYATQGFVYSNHNNWNTTNSSDGSAAWTEAVVNLTLQPQPRLRIGMQARYFLLGIYGNTVTLDWAHVDFKLDRKLGFRAGKLKTPAGLLNEDQDIDPALLWVMLPQSVYAISSRDSILAHYGGVIYGTVPLGERLGKLDYRAYGGHRIVGSDDEYLAAYRSQGLFAPSGASGPAFGGTLHWNAPVAGLMLGASATSNKFYGPATAFGLTGDVTIDHLRPYFLFGRYERGKVMLGGEYNRFAGQGIVRLNGIAPIFQSIDDRGFYVMGSYKIWSRWTGGLYYSSVIDRKAAFTAGRYQKDWAISSRYDFNPYLYLKLEEHVIDGTLRGFDPSNNSGGLKPDTRMTLLKLGVSF